jgi:hypothetical protein
MSKHEALIPLHGGYRKLKSFRVAQLVYDVTVRFCEQFVERRSPTCDQMVQATRSGVQNLAEGSQASGTSKTCGDAKSCVSTRRREGELGRAPAGL